MTRVALTDLEGVHCPVERSLPLLGDRWTLLILLQAMAGRTRFSEFRSELGIAADVLAQRLSTLADAGLLEKRPYRDPGARARHSYHLTRAGADAKIILGALQQWGDAHRAHPDGPLVQRRSIRSGRPVRMAFVDDLGVEVPPEDVDLVAPTAAASESG